MASGYVLKPATARRLRSLLNGAMSVGGSVYGSRAYGEIPQFAAPFTIRWASSLASPETSEGAGDATSGKFVVYVPTDDVLVVSGEVIDAAAELDAVEGWPTGWYALPDDLLEESGGSVYLNVTSGSASFASEPSGDLSVLIATVEIDDEGDGAVRVNQFVRSSLVMAGETDKSCFRIVMNEVDDPENPGETIRVHQLDNQFYMAGNVIRAVSPIDETALEDLVAEGKCYVALKLTYDGASVNPTATIEGYATLTALANEAATNPRAMVVPLYKLSALQTDFEEGDMVPVVVAVDFRTAVRVQQFEMINAE